MNEAKAAEQKETPKENPKKNARLAKPAKALRQGKLAVILVRGIINTKASVKETLRMLGLKRKNTCVIIPDTPSYRGMLNKVKDFVTWGSLDADTENSLVQKRKTNHDNLYHLNPPRKGFGRKGIKQSFNIGGALGNRKEKINDLIARMI